MDKLLITSLECHIASSATKLLYIQINHVTTNTRNSLATQVKWIDFHIRTNQVIKRRLFRTYILTFFLLKFSTYMALLHSDPSKHSTRIMTTFYKFDIMHAWLGSTLVVNVVE